MSKQVEAQEENQMILATPNQPATIEQDGYNVSFVPTTVGEKLMSGAAGNFITTIQNDGSPQTQARIYNAINDNTGNIGDMVNTTLEVTDLMAFPVKITQASGDQIDGIRVVVITKDGKSYGSVAAGIFSSLQNIIAICGMGPWEGLKLTPVTKKTRMGFSTLVFRMDV